MNDGVLRRTVRRLLEGEGAHVPASNVFDGLDWKLASVRPPGVAHSAFQLLNHMAYWDEWVAQWLDGREPALPAHASDSWPGGDSPTTPAEWRRAVSRFRQGLRALDQRSCAVELFSRPGGKTCVEMLATIGSHTSYHVGQVAVLRQVLGSWPPPTGGLTW